MTDADREIVERLRTPEVRHTQVSDDGEPYETVARSLPIDPLRLQAADLISRLSQENEGLRTAAAQITLIRAVLDLRKIHDPVEAVRILFEEGRPEFERVRKLCGGSQAEADGFAAVRPASEREGE